VSQVGDPGAAGVSTTPARPETVTLLFADMEGSTALVGQLGDAYSEVLDTYRALLTAAVHEAGGQVMDMEGDGLFAAFGSGRSALIAAVEAQLALDGHDWPEGVTVRARMGVHTGEALHTPAGYVGMDVHRAARVAAAAHGGQILLSESTRIISGGSLPAGSELRDLGAHRLKDLTEPVELYQLAAPGLPSEFPPLRSLDAVPNNLPTRLTSFVGREAELAQALELLEGTRLLTLTGPGGTGKTRLGLQIAAAAAAGFADGVWFVPLAPISDPDLVVSTILKALGVQQIAGQRSQDRLLDHLRERELLLVLDNFEQLLDAAPMVARILQDAPGVKVLVTSRAPLRVYGEQELPVPPLSVPDPDHLPALDTLPEYEAVALFVQRAGAVRPGFSITSANAPAVAAICARLDGLPLAIELAAARVKLLSPEAILQRLEGRLSLLGGGPRDLPTRQQTLRDAIGWSYDLLDSAARRLFNRLSVFVGGCTLEHAEAVCAADGALGIDVLDGLAHLVDQSLLNQSEVAGEPRFWMLATIREYAVEQLEASGEAADIRRRHADVFFALAQEAAPMLTGPDSKAWLDRIEAELDNLRAVEEWALQACDAQLALSLPSTVWRFFHMRGYLEEGRAVFDAALALPGADNLTTDRAQGLEVAGNLAYWNGDMLEAERLYRASLEVYERIGDRAGIARSLYNLSFPVEFSHDRVEEAADLLARSLPMYEELGDRLGAAWVQWNWGYVSAMQGDITLARTQLQEALGAFREFGDQFGIGWGCHSLGQVELVDGHADVAAPLFVEALQIFHAAGDHSGLVLLLDDFAVLAGVRGDWERAACLHAAASVLRKRSGADAGQVLGGTVRPDLPHPADLLPPEDLARAEEQGAGMSLDAAVAYALEEADVAGS
jgi:predicted ATPase/class 3 adenylate cyclase